MKITSTEFVISAVKPEQYPDDALPEIALAGRSNVGKSSLINRLIQRKNLARTSGQPGKTQTLNYYRINNNMYFVDLPGYGFARVSQETRKQWGKMIEKYLTERMNLRAVLHLVDIRHAPSAEDVMMSEWLDHIGIETCVVATKADKIPKGKRPAHVKVIREKLGLAKDRPVIVFSSEEGLGKDELWAWIKPRLSTDGGTDGEPSETEEA
ncbi:ribosome biogenesis GTP-binding protein YihA/YsxC [Paenibacillus sp.]|uniref:ribosome biogenesis GTP-binding protein YihA/YsxC n=1 Tax=Paenibacillus sp. TaxID=58172 RepID=UPI002D2D702C|nr:ribosome biogenesis GTP-binding protein YihA/YsxC [Paenibacillus sp.]HZG87092.1 ribosome biogenesis GTP-binding protein YihA/YsxC [Paenibacillus sp.]